MPKDGSRIIPARAGSTAFKNACTQQNWDHPRSCGEHLIEQNRSLQTQGSSPLVRGAPVAAILMVGMAGIIPARAGSTYAAENADVPHRDHPRSCGEHFVGFDLLPM